MSKRLFKREKHAVLEKELRALNRRRKELYEEKYLTIPLEKPLLVGYEMVFIFRTDILGRPDFPTLEKLLPLISTILTGKTKHFTKRVRRKTKLATKEKGKKTIDIEHKTKDLEVREWEKLSPKERGYFFPTTTKTCSYWSCGLRTVYRWSYPWMLVSKVRKKYVTEILIPNPDTASEKAHIENYIEKRDLRGKMDKLLHGYHNYDRYWNPSKILYRLEEKQVWKEVRQELEWETPSVFEPFFSDFSAVKTIKPKYSERNNSAFFMVIIFKKCENQQNQKRIY
jgi:hypothetical protein